MKWLFRIFLAGVLLAACAFMLAWALFPRYAQNLANKAVGESDISIRIHDPGFPGLSGIPFGKLEVVFKTPPDSCSAAPSSYTMSVYRGALSWKASTAQIADTSAVSSGSFLIDLDLKADSVAIIQQNNGLQFFDEKPAMSIRMHAVRNRGLFPAFQPVSFKYGIEEARLLVNNLNFRGISYTVTIDRKNAWRQQRAPIAVKGLDTETGSVPVSDFQALFGQEKDPDKPCFLSFYDCSVNLFGLKAQTPRIDFDPKRQETSFILTLSDVPLDTIPGFKGTDPSRPFATGKLSGTIPVSIRDSKLMIRNATIRSDSNTRLRYYSSDRSPWLSLDFASLRSGLFSNLDATVLFGNSTDTRQAVSLQSFSSGFLGGKLSSGPSVYDPSSGKLSYAFKLDNVGLPKRIRLHGDFSGDLKGSFTGTLPISFKNDGYTINNAHITSKGSGLINHTPPRSKKKGKQSVIETIPQGVAYRYQEPDLRISRTIDGKTTIGFFLKKLTRETGGGVADFLSPKGTLSLWHAKNNPSLLTVHNFSAGFMNGSLALEKVDYDIQKQSARTELVLNNIPLQKLLDLQGMKKIFATGTISGTIPVTMEKGRFEIPEGNMSAEQTGTIVYATTEEERAAANESMRITYEALSDFRYSELMSSIQMNPDGQSTIQLSLKGVNPSFQDGRPVHLNLNVEQNLLDLLRSLTITSAIEQKISEKAMQQKK